MASTKDLTGCRILIKDKDMGTQIADTKILSFDMARNTVKIDAGACSFSKNREVLLLVFSGDKLLEFAGNMKRAQIAGEIEINLYQGREREERGNQRYGIELSGDALAIMIANRMIKLRKPIPIKVHNISASGLLIEAMPDSFERGDRIEIFLPVSESHLHGIYEVVRLHKQDETGDQFGCKVVNPNRMRK